ncbi:thiol-activated cytolysin family protein [Flavivirga amylovorans]|uniref:Thiol-activated cytolysin family protein n=1 Tax=Flavivirga amylovorans TaxID=870486 RepID=A0ABT8X271_9FLAO|nr:thiol-activated cytolysin family protein [Flavivirga amylovorans]MDO5988010.1 thiol-activated cytolysin family protein [Flavivirga amylovorans]
MKTQPLLFKSMIYALLFVFVLFPSCSKEDSEEDIKQELQKSIDNYLKELNYSSNELLGVEDTGSESSLKTKGESTDSNDNVHGENTSTVCTSTDYNLKTNFSNIPILDPNKGIIWPGALVYGDASLKRGMPTNINIDRAPMTLRIDLPGIGEAGNVSVELPKNSNTNSAIDDALEWWNANAYREGYVNPSNSTSEATTMYSKQQMSLELGLNAEWATGNISSEFDYKTSKEKRVAMMVYKQVFYTISMDQPLKPSDVFGESVSTEEVQDIFNANTPAAYIHNVSYGRIIMFRMETTAEATDLELKTAFEYATGKNKVDGDLEVKAKSILEQSSIKTFAIGGNAASTAELVSAKEFADLEPVIKGENAIYSRNNPGVPISYTVRYLKDNTLAKMGFSTDYTAVTCFSTGSSHPEIEFNNHTKNDGFRIGLTYKNNLPGEPSQSYGDLTKNKKWKRNEVYDSTSGLTLPNGAYDIRIYIELQIDDEDGSDSDGKINYWHVDENYKQRYFKKELGNYIHNGGSGLYDKCYIAEKKLFQPVTVRALKCP